MLIVKHLLYIPTKYIQNGTLVTSNIPVAWHYNSSQTGWTTNSPTGGTASATTITLAIPENKTTAQINYNWSAIQNEGRTSGAKSISIQFQHKAKYGTIAWNPSGDISVVSTATTVDKGIVVTGNFNDNISDSQGTDAANILTAVTITTSETWVTGITFSLTNSNYKFPMWTSETADRITTITLTINDPRLTLSGPSTFKITQKCVLLHLILIKSELILQQQIHLVILLVWVEVEIIQYIHTLECIMMELFKELLIFLIHGHHYLGLP